MKAIKRKLLPVEEQAITRGLEALGDRASMLFATKLAKFTDTIGLEDAVAIMMVVRLAYIDGHFEALEIDDQDAYERLAKAE